MSKKSQRQLDIYLSNFSQGTDLEGFLKSISDNTEATKQLPIPTSMNLNDPSIVYILFVTLKNFKALGKEEKVRWTIPVFYKGTPLILTYTKFGFKILMAESKEKLALEAFTKIKKAIPFAESLITPTIQDLIQHGNVTLDNQFYAIKSRYLFFRKQARVRFAKMAEINNPKLKEGSDELENTLTFIISQVNNTGKFARYGGNYAIAMIDSYFSLLEHTLVLISPFSNNLDITKENIEKFIHKNWMQLYELVLGKNEKSDFHFDRLLNIKDSFRNPIAHGHFLKGSNSLYVHFPQVGAIPVSFTELSKKLTYTFHPIDPLNFEEICSCFNEFDRYLKQYEMTKYGIKYLKSGLPVSFDAASCNTYKEAMKTSKKFNQFLEAASYHNTNEMNMDW